MADDRVPGPEPVAWDVADRTARQALRLSPPLDEATRQRLEDDFAELTERAEHLVEEATGLSSTAGPARAVVTDRAGWVSANIGSFQRLIRPVMDRMAEKSPRTSSLFAPAGRAAAGAEIGLLLAWISTRVLGQYDILPADGQEGGDGIYYVGPNIAAIERRHGFPQREFRLWIAIHEVTHRMQFTGVPWMAEYFHGLLERGTSLDPPGARTILDGLTRAVAEVKGGRNPLDEGGVVSLFATTEQLAMLREAQALMSLLEGHCDVIMGRAATDEIPGAGRFASVLSDRRNSTKGLAKLFQQMIGIEAKLRQYQEGERFVEAVLEAGGDELFSTVWSGPEQLPSIDEVREPERWIERVGSGAHAAS